MANRVGFILCTLFNLYFLFSVSTIETLYALFFPKLSVYTEFNFPSLLTVARAQSDSDSEEDAATAEVVEGADLGIVGDDTQVSSDGPLSPAPGVETVCVFPKNAGKSECISKYYTLYTLNWINSWLIRKNSIHICSMRCSFNISKF